MSETLANRTVVLVGRPNVGKSRLFNRLAGKRIAIVHDQPGVTRDVHAVEVADGGYTLLDSGGIGLTADPSVKSLVMATEEQVRFAIEAASLIGLVVDGREGLNALDERILAGIREAGKQPILIVNKIDHEGLDARAADFYRLGVAETFLVSAEHGRGCEELAERVRELLGPPPEAGSEESGPRRISLCFAGRPNVGKSSLCNRLLRSERLVVSEVPGTTRDAVALDLDYPHRGEVWRFRLVDTAGLRPRTRVSSPVEFFSGLRSREALSEADVVFHVLDARDGVTRQDKLIAGQVVEAGRPHVLVINKWDFAMEAFREAPLPGFANVREFRRRFEESVRRELFFLPDSPLVFVSAKSGHEVGSLLQAARQVDGMAARQLSTGRLNQVLGALLEEREPARMGGIRFKVYYATQVGSRPIRLKLFVNKAARLEESYRRYLEKGVLKAFSLSGVPIRLELVGKPPRGRPQARDREE